MGPVGGGWSMGRGRGSGHPVGYTAGTTFQRGQLAYSTMAVRQSKKPHGASYQ
jgi:hypothetical protein